VGDPKWTIGLRLHNPSQADEVAARISREVLPGSQVRTAADIRDNAFPTRTRAYAEVALLFAILMLAGAAMLVVTLLGSRLVSEARELTLLQVTGLTPMRLASLIAAEHAVIALAGVLAGIPVALLASPRIASAASVLGSVTPDLAFGDIVLVGMGAVAVSVIVSVLGRVQAGRRSLAVVARGGSGPVHRSRAAGIALASPREPPPNPHSARRQQAVAPDFRANLYIRQTKWTKRLSDGGKPTSGHLQGAVVDLNQRAGELDAGAHAVVDLDAARAQHDLLSGRSLQGDPPDAGRVVQDHLVAALGLHHHLLVRRGQPDWRRFGGRAGQPDLLGRGETQLARQRADRRQARPAELIGLQSADGSSAQAGALGQILLRQERTLTVSPQQCSKSYVTYHSRLPGTTVLPRECSAGARETR